MVAVENWVFVSYGVARMALPAQLLVVLAHKILASLTYSVVFAPHLQRRWNLVHRRSRPCHSRQPAYAHVASLHVVCKTGHRIL